MLPNTYHYPDLRCERTPGDMRSPFNSKLRLADATDLAIEITARPGFEENIWVLNVDRSPVRTRIYILQHFYADRARPTPCRSSCAMHVGSA